LTRRVRSRKRIALIGCAVFAALSFALAVQGGMPWWAGAFWIVGFLALLLPASKGPVDEVEVSDLGVTRRFGPRLGKKRQERVLWDELVRVEILTTDEGPFTQDFFFLLVGRDGGGVAVSNELAVKHGLVAILQRRFSGIDDKAIIEASDSTQVRRFLVWQKQDRPMPGSEVR
jgi:hypothetical protein